MLNPGSFALESSRGTRIQLKFKLDSKPYFRTFLLSLLPHCGVRASVGWTKQKWLKFLYEETFLVAKVTVLTFRNIHASESHAYEAWVNHTARLHRHTKNRRGKERKRRKKGDLLIYENGMGWESCGAIWLRNARVRPCLRASFRFIHKLASRFENRSI